MDALLNALDFIRSNPALVAVAGGFITPLLVSLLQQPRLTKIQRTAVAIAGSVVMGGAAALSTGMFNDAKDLVTVLIVLYTASETFYQKLWKHTGLTDRIELATAIRPKVPHVIEGELVHERE